MALQSSGQISLSNIATEFGGSAPHALSEYYGSDTVPSSGQISFSNFYGTSAFTGFAQGNIGVGNRNIKAGTDQRGYSNGNSYAGTGSQSFGSISNFQISNTSRVIAAIYIQQGFGAKLNITFTGSYTGWTTLTINGNYSVNRTSASSNNNNQRYEWNGNYNLPTTFTIT